LDSRNCLVHNATARALLINTTTLGAHLDAFVQSKQSVEQFTQDLMRQARGDVAFLIRVHSYVLELSGAAFEKLVCMLLEDRYKDGVAVELTLEFAERPIIIRVVTSRQVPCADSAIC
jgi:hypothetical protein